MSNSLPVRRAGILATLVVAFVCGTLMPETAWAGLEDKATRDALIAGAADKAACIAAIREAMSEGAGETQAVKTACASGKAPAPKPTGGVGGHGGVGGGKKEEDSSSMVTLVVALVISDAILLVMIILIALRVKNLRIEFQAKLARVIEDYQERTAGAAAPPPPPPPPPAAGHP